jgi:Ser/Thr protein kinase RdoA (MazF antagonist)
MTLDSEKAAQLTAALAAWDIPPLHSIEAVGDSLDVFKVTTPGQAFTLKDISRAPNVRRLAFTRAVLTHLARAGLQVPVPRLTRSGEAAAHVEGRLFLLCDYIEAGAPATDPALLPELFEHTGQAIARLHQALAAYPDPNIAAQTWREDLAAQVPGWLAALEAGLPARQAAIVQRVRLGRGDALAAALHGLPEQLIHRDCHPGNILVQGTRVIGFIDCDHLCLGPWLFDLASYAIHQVKWVTEDAAATEGWLRALPHLLRGYRSVQSLSPQEAAALPHALMAYHLLLSDWFMSQKQMDGIGLEMQSLAWIDEHFELIHRVATGS